MKRKENAVLYSLFLLIISQSVRNVNSILTFSTFMWLFHVFNQNVLLLVLDVTLQPDESQRFLISCQCLYTVSLIGGNIESNFLRI